MNITNWLLKAGGGSNLRDIMKRSRKKRRAVQAESSETLVVQAALQKQLEAGIAAIATNAWRAKIKIGNEASGEVREEMKRVYRHVESILESLQDMGVQIKDHTGDAFDYGLPLKVVTTQPTPGITKEKVIQTIKPTVYWQNQIIQKGEVVIATPAQTQEKR